MTSINNSGRAPIQELPTEVIKCDGGGKRFDAEKVESAIARAGVVTGEFGADSAARVTAQVLKVISRCYAASAPTIESIQDIVEQPQIAADFMNTARAYIVYREQHEQLRADRKTLMGVAASITSSAPRSTLHCCRRTRWPHWHNGWHNWACATTYCWNFVPKVVSEQACRVFPRSSPIRYCSQ